MKTFTQEATSNKDYSRVVDREGNWQFYFHSPSKQYFRAVNFILRSGYPMGEGLVRFFKTHTEEEAEKLLKRGGDRGDAIHQYIKRALAGEQMDFNTLILSDDNVNYRHLTDDEWLAVKSFEHFWNIHGASLISSEQTVGNTEKQYAGTLDAIVILTKKCESRFCKCDELVGKIGLLDWKTGGGIYDDYGPQVAAYANADLTDILKGKLIDYTGIIQFGAQNKANGGYKAEFYNFQETEKHWKEFCASIVNADRNYKPFDPEKEIYEIPETFHIEVNQYVAEVKAKKPRKPRAKKVGKINTELNK